jgi:hypothetical protein
MGRFLSVQAGPLPEEYIEKHEPGWEKALQLIQQLAEQ